MTSLLTTSSRAPARDPMEVYLERLEERDRREQKHKKYIDAYQTLADKTAAIAKARTIAEREAAENAPKEAPETPAPDTKARPKWNYYPSYGGKSSPTPPPSASTDPAHIAQLRSDLAMSNQVRAEQEAELKAARAENAENKVIKAEQSRRIAEIEKQNKRLEHRVANTTEEVKKQRELAVQAQDEMVALQLELNAKDKEVLKVKADNKMLVDRWMAEKGEVAERMNKTLEKGQKKR
ncbi:autophagy protein 16 [Bimuria novae-zelandiae CBS 107.79]|uniref:Autophagy protein 16 n=1 Tax=Bimuria novae-zelandiae CBS 107.79 TaxID=1447943 RepID=A0A6A5UWH7_9PLEO|nr:autophagy protein 16 [Bimuria novae-zelandiae CBS 107.79]